MSTQYSTGEASNCIDGITTYSCYDDSCVEGSVCHTEEETSNWLLITVTDYSVDKVIVYNRLEDYAQDRVNDATITYSSDAEGRTVLYQSSFGSARSLTYTFNFAQRYTYSLRINVNDDIPGAVLFDGYFTVGTDEYTDDEYGTYNLITSMYDYVGTNVLLDVEDVDSNPEANNHFYPSSLTFDYHGINFEYSSMQSYLQTMSTHFNIHYSSTTSTFRLYQISNDPQVLTNGLLTITITYNG